jgi:hypothetical protein
MVRVLIQRAQWWEQERRVRLGSGSFVEQRRCQRRIVERRLFR